jgi:hypothetical protein
MDPKALSPGTLVGIRRPDGTTSTTRLVRRSVSEGCDLGAWVTAEPSPIGGFQIVGDDHLASGRVFVVLAGDA